MINGEVIKGGKIKAKINTVFQGEIVFYQKTNNLIFWDAVYNVWDEVYFELPELKPL